MNQKPPTAINAWDVTDDLLRAFVEGRLDENTEDRLVAIFDQRPDLADKAAAIPVDSVIEKMRAHRDITSATPIGNPLTTPLSESFAQSGKLSDDAADLTELLDYTIIREIGRGGMGMVYLAKHNLTGREETLKVLNERLMPRLDARKRFEQEIKCIASMNHETIVRCHGVLQLRNAAVLCMEYVPGLNLLQFISQKGPLPIHVACGIASQVCRGLQHAMENGLVHRDIKPSNIMLHRADGKTRVKILDFGLARLTSQEQSQGLTTEGALLGTLEYIAPEQTRNAKDVDIRADIYSLGCTLYHMLAGAPPFTGNPGALVLAHDQSPPTPVGQIRSGVPDRLSNIVDRMLAKEPDQRFATPLETRQALEEFAQEYLPNSQLESDQMPASQIIVPDITAPPIHSELRDTSIDQSTETRGTRPPSSPDTKLGDADSQFAPIAIDNAESPNAHRSSAPQAASAIKKKLSPRTMVLIAISAIIPLSLLLTVIVITIRNNQTTIEIKDETAETKVASLVESPDAASLPELTDSWQILFDGTKESFNRNWRIQHLQPPGKLVFKDTAEMELVCGPGENDFIGFVSNREWGPNFQLSMKYRNGNGSPKVLDFTWHNGTERRNLHYLVSLGGHRESKQFSPIKAVGSLEASYIRVPGTNFDFRASPMNLQYGNLCAMELLCFDGNLAVKVDGKVVNQLDRNGKEFKPKHLHFWTKRASRITFQEVKIRSLADETAFKNALALPSE